MSLGSVGGRGTQKRKSLAKGKENAVVAGEIVYVSEINRLVRDLFVRIGFRVEYQIWKTRDLASS
jgi:hypothetical protein